MIGWAPVQPIFLIDVMVGPLIDIKLLEVDRVLSEVTFFVEPSGYVAVTMALV